MERWPDRRRRMLMGLSIVVELRDCSASSSTSTSSPTTSTQVLALVGLHRRPPALRVMLPVGISFYTFQAMSYTIDVYRGDAARRAASLLDVAVFISFFPHLVAGPIERASYLLPQVERERRCRRSAGARAAFLLIVWGYLQEAGDCRQRRRHRQQGVRARSDPSFAVLWAGVFAFAIQIYADFSAYTDIARGVVAMARASS